MGFFDKFKKRKTKRTYHNNGKLKKIENFKGDKLDGLVIENHENGRLWYSAEYKEGLQDGKITSYHEDGNKIKESHLNKGEYNGNQIEWWSNGQIKAKREYKNGKVISEQNFPDKENSNDNNSSELLNEKTRIELQKIEKMFPAHCFPISIKSMTLLY